MAQQTPDDSELQLKREKERLRRRNLYITIGGVASLILPLLGVAYMRLSDNFQPARPNLGNSVFSRRAGEPGAKKKITPARVSAAPLPNPLTVEVLKTSSDRKKPARQSEGLTQDSLSFIRGGGEYYKDKKPAPPPQSPAPIPPKPEPKKIPPKPVKKPAPMPKLKNTNRFSDFKSKEALQQVLPGEDQPMPDMEAIMKQAGEGN